MYSRTFIFRVMVIAGLAFSGSGMRTGAVQAAVQAAAPVVSSWTVNPWAIPAGSPVQSIITAQVSDADGDLQSVTVDLSQVGGKSAAPLVDDGAHHDGAPGDGVFGLAFSASSNAKTGEIPLTLTISDRQGNRLGQPLGTFLVLVSPRSGWPGSLPQFLGMGSGDDEWQATTGLPWNYTTHFLGWNWTDWGTQYVASYVKQAWSHGTIPVFTVNMVQGGAPCGALSESDCYVAHFQDPTIMAGYFDRLKEAARQAKGSQPVIFQLETDGVAYMHRYSDNHAGENGMVADEPSSIPAQSGDPAYPNTFAGAVHRMVDVIHQQAPNALVALHARSWATGMDLAGTVPAKLDISLTARRMAHFLTEAGGPGMNLISIDWKVYDAGSGSGSWWDATNQTIPNFNRTLYWQNLLSVYSGRRLLLWKVPVGNMALDNTCEHYQDNKVEYIFDHTRDLVEAGILGVVFGGGDDCRTTVTTDGGYLQQRATQYYSSPTAPSVLVPSGSEMPIHLFIPFVRR